jgi:hypothetical protein
MTDQSFLEAILKEVRSLAVDVQRMDLSLRRLSNNEEQRNGNSTVGSAQASQLGRRTPAS